MPQVPVLALPGMPGADQVPCPTGCLLPVTPSAIHVLSCLEAGVRNVEADAAAADCDSRANAALSCCAHTQASRSTNAQSMGSPHYQEALQGSQPPAMDVMQHMAHMQALLAGATSASLQVTLRSAHTFEISAVLLATCSLYDITHVLSQNGSCVPHWGWPCRTPI